MRHAVISQAEWLKARRVLLAKQAGCCSPRKRSLPRKPRDQPSAARPRVKVERNYVLHGPDGKKSLAELLNECSHECETRAAFVLKEDTHTFTLDTSGSAARNCRSHP